MPDDRDAVADPLHLREDVGGEEDRPPGGAQLVEDLVEGPLHQRIEALRRLVEDRQLRVVLEGLHDPELLAHAPAVVPDGPAAGPASAELQAVEEPAAEHGRPAVERPQVVAAGRSRSSCRRGRSRRAGSRPGRGSPRRPAARVEAEDPGRSRGRVEEAEEEADAGALAGSVGTEEPEDLAGVHAQRRRRRAPGRTVAAAPRGRSRRRPVGP